MFFSSLFSVLTILLSLNKADGVYQSEDTVRVFATENNVTTLVHEQVYTGPQNVIFKYGDSEIGWVIAPEKYSQSVPCPKDFDRFWKREIAKMRKIPMEPSVKEIFVEGRDNVNFVCYELTLRCVDDTPVRGYVAMPRDARRKSLPIVTFFHAAGVTGGWCRSNPSQTMDMAAWGDGAICIDINAFGMLNDQSEQYYKTLSETALKDYSTKPSESRESYFFKNMYLRAIRALDYACSLKEWDGKRVLAYGQSQGGAQCIALAGLDKRVTAVVGIVPAGFNSAGSYAQDGEDSWPFIYKQYADKEKGAEIISYFDGCNFLKRTKAKIWIEVGLMDQTCLPSAIWSGINICPSKDITVKSSPYRFHDEPKPRYHKQWRESIADKRMQWVNDYLRSGYKSK